MPYIANTKAERQEMLDAIGVSSMEELWNHIGITNPTPELNLADGLSEYDVLQKITKLSNDNVTDHHCFMGGGFYDHYIPAAVNSTISRGEFLTAYTPYQPEVSQGTLQSIYEYQTMICRITGMEVSNASMYEGGTALYESLLMAVRQNRKHRIVVAGTLSPIYRHLIDSYRANMHLDIVYVEVNGVEDDVEKLLAAVDKETSAVVVQYPNFYGQLTDWTDFIAQAKTINKKLLAICSSYPMALSLFKSPGEMGFDIVSGEAQCFGMPLMFGGPYLGYLATSKKLMRKMPGRICGRTEDGEGKEGFVLTLQAREQHIRREKANSNICSNQGLCALAATVYLSLIGEGGFEHIGKLSHSRAHWLYNELAKVDGITPVGSNNFFNEFVVELSIDGNEFCQKMLEHGINAAIPLGALDPNHKNLVMIAVTEKRNLADLKAFVAAAKEVVC